MLDFQATERGLRFLRGLGSVRGVSTTPRIELGGHIVADPRICHGKPTFKGTRIMVWQVLEDVADGKSWDFISQVRWGGRLSVAAIAEAGAPGPTSLPRSGRKPVTQARSRALR